MPVSIDEFESGELPENTSIPEQTVVFLSRHDDKAFTRSEIAAGIDADVNVVGTALSRVTDPSLLRSVLRPRSLREGL